MAALSLSELSELLQCTTPVADIPAIHGVNTLTAARAGEASFLANRHYLPDLLTTQASVVLVDQATQARYSGQTSAVLLACEDPYLAFARLQRHFHPQPASSGQRHPAAVIAASAQLADDVDVAAGAVIGEGCQIATGCRIGAGAVIGRHCQLGEGCLIHPRAVIADGCLLGKRVILQPGAVIGSDGFGYAWDGKAHVKIPQTGIVELHDDVEIGANTCIDRGALGNTVVHQGVKIDNLVQLGHNVEIGACSVLVSQVGISGSTQIGRGCQLGGQAGVAGHLSIGDGCKVAAQSGVIGNLEAGGTYGGTPAIPHRIWLRSMALLNRLPELFRKNKA